MACSWTDATLFFNGKLHKILLILKNCVCFTNFTLMLGWWCIAGLTTLVFPFCGWVFPASAQRLVFQKDLVCVVLLVERKEGNVLFNDTLSTFYWRLYGIGHMVKNHSDCERGKLLPLHGLLLLISSKGSFICTIPQIW